jgi:hypothetical protein
MESYMSLDNTVIELDPALQAGFESCGSAFADSELTADESLLTHAKHLGSTPSFDLWEAGRVAWSKGYSAGKGYAIESDATVKAWSRFASRLEKTYGLTKPKKATKEAEAKQDQREKAKSTLNDLKAKSYEELQSEVAMLLAKPTLENVSKSKPFLKAIEEKRKEGLKDRMDNIKAMQSEIVGLVKKCLDEKQLQAIQAILNDYDFEIAGM